MGQVKTREVKHRVLPRLEKGALALAAVFQPKVELVVSKAPTSQVSVIILYSYVLWLYHFNVNYHFLSYENMLFNN